MILPVDDQRLFKVAETGTIDAQAPPLRVRLITEHRVRAPDHG
jgi:hypothetical protein